MPGEGPGAAVRVGRGPGRRPGPLAARRADPARRAGAGRRAAKWVRRNRAVSALATGIVFALVAGSVVSAVYAVKADKRAREAAANEWEANRQAAGVKDRESLLQDTLCVATFERAKALRLVGRPGWRARTLELLTAAAEMRLRSRNPDDTRVALPELADLRGEAVMALLQPDVFKVRELSAGLSGSPLLSADGSRALTSSPQSSGAPTVHHSRPGKRYRGVGPRRLPPTIRMGSLLSGLHSGSPSWARRR